VDEENGAFEETLVLPVESRRCVEIRARMRGWANAEGCGEILLGPAEGVWQSVESVAERVFPLQKVVGLWREEEGREGES
jgi:hypothetical protein